MLVFCHLVAGAACGLLGARTEAARPLLAAGMIGAILPDLIDKPIGHLLLAGTLDNGRIVSHSLGFFLVVLVAGTLLLRRRHPLLGPMLALGVLSHQLLDAMWRDPEGWLYPLLGPFVPGRYPDYFLHGLLAELSSPAEWLFGVTILTLLVAAYRPAPIPSALRRSVGRLLPFLAVLVGVLGLLSLVGAALGLPNAFTHLSGPGDNALLGLAAIGGSVAILRGHPDELAPGE